MFQSHTRHFRALNCCDDKQQASERWGGWKINGGRKIWLTKKTVIKWWIILFYSVRRSRFFFSFSIEHKIILRSSNDSRHSHILALVSLAAERENETEVVVAINPHALLLLVKLLPESEIWIYDRGKVFESTNSAFFYDILASLPPRWVQIVLCLFTQLGKKRKSEKISLAH